MRSIKRDFKTSMALCAILAGTTAVAVAAVPQPPIDGVVVEDSTRSYSFDRIGTDFDEEAAPRGATPVLTLRMPPIGSARPRAAV